MLRSFLILGMSHGMVGWHLNFAKSVGCEGGDSPLIAWYNPVSIQIELHGSKCSAHCRQLLGPKRGYRGLGMKPGNQTSWIDTNEVLTRSLGNLFVAYPFHRMVEPFRYMMESTKETCLMLTRTSTINSAGTGFLFLGVHRFVVRLFRGCIQIIFIFVLNRNVTTDFFWCCVGLNGDELVS